MHNLTSVTARIPFPHSTSQPIPWAVLPMNSSLLGEYDNIEKAFERANVSYYLEKEKKCRQRGSDVL